MGTNHEAVRISWASFVQECPKYCRNILCQIGEETGLTTATLGQATSLLVIVMCGNPMDAAWAVNRLKAQGLPDVADAAVRIAFA